MARRRRSTVASPLARAASLKAAANQLAAPSPAAPAANPVEIETLAHNEVILLLDGACGGL